MAQDQRQALHSASINFCEADYFLSDVVVEFWNTVSSLGIVAIGIYGARRW
jgi:hypothetical protein